MIQFMVLGAPRSGTAWASVWLNAYHDPLWDHFHEDLDHLPITGICCTGVAMVPDWVNAHHSKKIILHRPEAEVNRSLSNLGVGACSPLVFDNLQRIKGLHLDWQNLFDSEGAYKIWSYLFTTPFDFERHRQLIALKINTHWQLRVRRADPAVARRYAQRGFLVKPPNPLDDI